MKYAGFSKRVALVLGCLAVGAIFPFVYRSVGSVPPKQPFSSFPKNLGDWTAGKDYPMGADAFKMLKVHDYIMRDYSKGDKSVTLYIGYYGSLDRGEEVHSPRVCMPSSGWLKLKEQTRTIPVPGGLAGSSMEVVEAVFEKLGRKQAFLFWYQVGGQTLTEELLIKLVIIKNTLLHHRPDSAFIRITANVRGNDVDAAVNAAYEFLQDAIPEIYKFLPSRS